MTTKNLAIREKVYEKLAEAKHEGESFSDVIERILEKRGNLLSLWGILADSQNVKKIEDDTTRIRKRATVRA
jgi:predicted CopG family antitoxin